jgi:hypothetical protein
MKSKKKQRYIKEDVWSNSEKLKQRRKFEKQTFTAFNFVNMLII